MFPYFLVSTLVDAHCFDPWLPRAAARRWRPPARADSPTDAIATEDAGGNSGFYQGLNKYVEISSDGYYARHRDDTGEVMHGVVMGEEPLALSGQGSDFLSNLEHIWSREKLNQGLCG